MAGVFVIFGIGLCQCITAGIAWTREGSFACRLFLTSAFAIMSIRRFTAGVGALNDNGGASLLSWTDRLLLPGLISILLLVGVSLMEPRACLLKKPRP